MNKNWVNCVMMLIGVAVMILGTIVCVGTALYAIHNNSVLGIIYSVIISAVVLALWCVFIWAVIEVMR